MRAALSSDLREDARKSFDAYRLRIESALSPEFLAQEFDVNSFSLGASRQEIEYRRWCLKNRLFLNPLNDLGPYPIGGRDTLTTPDIVDSIDTGPRYPGFFNQMKQEFTSARYLYYEGVNEEQPHFSDRGVLLYNTLDYPSYSLAIERVKSAFRMCYSIFDKAAFFLNHYLDLAIPEKSVTFKTFWYIKQSRKKGLRADFENRQNWPLRGLFWLSKDLYEEEAGFKEAIEPDARELSEIRNHLEHKYLKLHGDDWSGPPPANDELSRSLSDTLAFSIYRRDFERKTLRLLKLSRTALMYLSLAIDCEEQQRKKKKDPNSFVMRTPLDVWEDEWKV